MSYAIIQPPFTLQFDRMSKPELAAYRGWFLEMVPIRRQILQSAVQTTAGYASWQMDATPASLDQLGEWFAQEVSLRRRSIEEMVEIGSRVPLAMHVPDSELTNRTYSLAMDIGMYLGEVMLKNVPGLRWEQPLKSKRDADYGQVCIRGPGLIAMNTVRMAVTLAFGIAKKAKDGRGLRKIYDIWSGSESGLFLEKFKTFVR